MAANKSTVLNSGRSVFVLLVCSASFLVEEVDYSRRASGNAGMLFSWLCDVAFSLLHLLYQ
jgi:hypothetical protein